MLPGGRSFRLFFIKCCWLCLDIHTFPCCFMRYLLLSDPPGSPEAKEPRMPDERDLPKFIFQSDVPKYSFLSNEATRKREAEEARQREMAVLRHKRMRAGQAPMPMSTSVDHFQRDYPPSNPGSRGGVPYLTGNPQTHADKAWDEHEKWASGGDHHGEWYPG